MNMAESVGVCRTCALHKMGLGERTNYTWRLLSAVLFLVFCFLPARAQERSCYDNSGEPQRCTPEFVNAAYNRTVEATNTCGIRKPSIFCHQTSSGSQRLEKSCEICDSISPWSAHPSEYLTDFNQQENETWWQSGTMYDGVRYPEAVNLTLHLGKAFDITYIRLKFYSPRPESFAIYKRTGDEGEWLPYQYYSSSCRDTYGLPSNAIIRAGDDARAYCSKDFSEISPLSGGNVAFSTLEGRPGAYNFENRPDLQEWVTATSIRISLTRMNTFGDEVFGDPKVLQSYFYAITDLAIGGRCKCNGHASDCAQQWIGSRVRLICLCEHNTAGPDCNECLPFYNDAPWKRATASDAHSCKPCNCNGRSNRCYFDKELYEQTGHGGHCLECSGNTDGPNCERCKENFYLRRDGYCIPCQCNEIGSRSLQCNVEGKCQCKPGVVGDKCDQCDANHFGFGQFGCSPCECNPSGSFRNTPYCNNSTGDCSCKENVEGKRCEKCKPGFFNLNIDNVFGCTPCFCFGHSAICESAPGHGKTLIESTFSRGDERWGAEEAGAKASINYDGVAHHIRVGSHYDEVYFVAPGKYLGDQRASYNQDLMFNLRVGEEGAKASVRDIILESPGFFISQPIFGQANQLPSIQDQKYTFRLHENPDYGWSPTLSSKEFISLLSNLTAIRIRGTYRPQGAGFLDDVTLHSARRGAVGGPATWIELCTCPEGYVGQFCESCSPGYRHDPPNGGPFARCVPCNCNGHADICDSESGKCICNHNTDGNNCEFCKKGYYGNALQGSDDDCKVCPCPDSGACIELPDGVMCIECPIGYTGPRCNLCVDGYFGDPTGRFDEVQPCKECDCNGNIDPNAVGNCNSTTGECLKCIYSTAGKQCEVCKPGYYGDALAIPKGDCRSCNCNPLGSVPGPRKSLYLCDQLSGQCQCKPHVTGPKCDRCGDGFYNLDSGEGCQACNCDPVGSLNQTCHEYAGQCFCRDGVIGKQCDQCAVNHYGFSYDGCLKCDCDPIGSLGLQCDSAGQCPCRDNVEGRHCDRCKENKFNRQAGCQDCPACYNLVQEAANSHRSNLEDLKNLLKNIALGPSLKNDDDFVKRLAETKEQVDTLYNAAKENVNNGGDKSALENLESIKEKLFELTKTLKSIDQMIDESEERSHQSKEVIDEAHKLTEEFKESLSKAMLYLGSDGKDALNKAKERSDKFGQQSDKMSKIARDARELADGHEAEALELEKLAENAYNLSTEAHQLASGAIYGQRETDNLVSEIKKQTEDLEKLGEQTRQNSEYAKSQSLEAFENALSLLTEAKTLSTPDLPVADLSGQATKNKEEADKIKEEARELVNKNKNLMANIERQTDQGNRLLSEAESQQNIIDEFFAEIDTVSAKAEEAVNKADNTLKEAKNTLNILEEFDKTVQESKEQYSNSRDEIPEIAELITEAEAKTDDAANALLNAEEDATKAHDVALSAKDLAGNISKDAANIRQDAKELITKTYSLKDEADRMSQQTAEVSSQLVQLEDEAGYEEKLIKSALAKSHHAKSNASEAGTKIQQAIETVENILESLQQLDNIDNQQLDDIERSLQKAENEFSLSNLDKKIEELQEARKQQNYWKKKYEEEVALLTSEVNNVESIKLSLPEGCFKRLKLEP